VAATAWVWNNEPTTDGTSVESKVPPARRNRAYQALIVVLLFLGYSGYYLCRSNLSVSMKAIEGELVANGSFKDGTDAKKALSSIVSLGILAYAIGKFAAGNLADTFGGRWNFLQGMAWSVLCTIGFALSGIVPLFTLAWLGNRSAQSLGWVGAIKIASKWFSFGSYGTVMALISLSFLFGNWASKQFLGQLFLAGLSWRMVFGVAAMVLTGLLALNFWLLKESPGDVGLEEPEHNPTNLFADQDGVKPGLLALWMPLMRSTLFWVVCLLSVGMTFIRESMNTWTPTFLQEVLHSDPGRAAQQSSWFDFWGGVSVIVAGLVGDALGRRGRAIVITVGMTATAYLLYSLGGGGISGSRLSPVVLITLSAFTLLGPYSFLAGAVALDFGGKRGSATAAGVIDGVGYLIGGALAGRGIAELQDRIGWNGAFETLAWVAFASAVGGAVFFAMIRAEPGRRSADG
jgi:sugar phosphate permease